MTYITTTGNLAKTPELRTGEKGNYCFARILVTDRFRNDDGTYTDGATIGYDVSVSGSQAENLVATAQASGNVRVTFSGRLQVSIYHGENGTRTQYKVRADEIGISLRGQTVTVERATATEEATADNYGDDTPF